MVDRAPAPIDQSPVKSVSRPAASIPDHLKIDRVYFASCDLSATTNDSTKSSIHSDESIWRWDFTVECMEQLGKCYAPIEGHHEVETVHVCQRNIHHKIGGLFSQMNVVSLENKLLYENDDNLHEYLSFGITNGFYIVNPNEVIEGYICKNYSSVLKGDAYKFVDNLMREELNQDMFIISQFR